MKELAVFGREEMRADRARHVAAVGRILDLDDFRAEIREIKCAEWPGPVLLDREHAHAF
ncbi:hypothetical protein D3C83_100470 [compost metagenome]